MKEEIRNNEERLDLLFRENFKNFEDKPSGEAWDQIQNSMNNESFDEIFKAKIKNIEQTPSPEVWENVQEGLPLNLFVKKHLENLMKIAAALLCIMSATLFFTSQPNSNRAVAVVNKDVIETPTSELSSTPPIIEIEVETKADFVYKIESKNKKKKRRKKANKKEDVNVDELWQLLMEDEDEFADAFDEAEKLEILSPPIRLPLIEESIPTNNKSKMDVDLLLNHEAIVIMENKDLNTADSLLSGDIAEVVVEEMPEVELKIWVPLVVVEKHEIERLINIYDEATAAKKPTVNPNNQ